MLNHWDNLDGTVERGYAGRSIFWGRGHIDTLTICRYGEKNQAVGINGTVLNNVNASPLILTAAYLDTVTIYANLLRTYGVRVFLSVNFASPKALGATDTADPLDPGVIKWWEEKAQEIYKRIPDFGGFLVKANSEGQPGPCDYGRSHAEGANMLAKAIQKASCTHSGVFEEKRNEGRSLGMVIWRAFVYNADDPDRAKQAYNEFASLDGQFEDNVIIQIKRGPIDFQPREPASPLFFAMPNTHLMAEFQLTQEYFGHSNHIVYLNPMWREFDRAIRNRVHLSGYAAVANIGTNGCGNKLAELNWYAFGRLTSDTAIMSEPIIRDWIRKNIPGTHIGTQDKIARLLLMSRETVVDYMMPLGLHHLFAWGHHYGPEPWCDVPGARPDWLPSYYHRADEKGIGFDRTMLTGSGATGQYPQDIAARFEPLSTCPERFLLWFHHVPWDYTRGWECCGGQKETLWLHLGRHYQRGVDGVKAMIALWRGCDKDLPHRLYYDIEQRLETQLKDAIWWRDACLLYFQQYSHMPWPSTAEAPVHKLEDMKKVHLGISNFECPTSDLLDGVR